MNAEHFMAFRQIERRPQLEQRMLLGFHARTRERCAAWRGGFRLGRFGSGIGRRWLEQQEHAKRKNAERKEFQNWEIEPPHSLALSIEKQAGRPPLMSTCANWTSAAASNCYAQISTRWSPSRAQTPTPAGGFRSVSSLKPSVERWTIAAAMPGPPFNSQAVTPSNGFSPNMSRTTCGTWPGPSAQSNA